MKPLKLDEIASAMEARPLGQPGRITIDRVATDSRQIRQGDLFFAIRGERFDGHDYVAAAIDRGAMAAVVCEPDRVPADLHQLGLLLLVDETTRALGRLASFHRRQVRATVIGVTGSNGKTTTKEMIHHVLSARRRGSAAPKSFNNEIGVPLTLLGVDPDDDYVVVEIGSNAPGEIGRLSRLAGPDVGVVTSISETHLEKLGSLDGVADEKASLIDHVREGGCAIVTAESDALGKRARRWRKRKLRQVWFGLGDGADLRATDVAPRGAGVSFRVDGVEVTLPVPGAHNVWNALAALGVGREMGVTFDEAAGRLAGFQPPPMRLNVQRMGSVTVINDAYNANPASMRAALDVLVSWGQGGASSEGESHASGRKVFIAGDMRELGEVGRTKHEELGRAAALAGLDALAAVGEYADVVAEAARREAGGMDVVTAADAEALADRLDALVRPGDVVLIKGSRAVGLERVAEMLGTRFGSGATDDGA